MSGRSAVRLVLATLPVLLLVAGCREGLVYLLDVPEITIDQLRGRRAGGAPEDPAPLLLDVREAHEYRAGHVPGTLHVPRAALPAFLATRGRPEPVVTVCDSGYRSAYAVVEMRGLGWTEVRSLREGTTGWRERDLPLERPPDGAPLPPVAPRVPEQWSTFQQLAATTSGLVIKPTYMVLCLCLILVLRRAGSRDLVLVRRALVIFLVGEGFCAVAFLTAGSTALLLDVFHGLGMVGMGLYLPWGFFVMLDERVLRLHDPKARCVVQRFCGTCVKKDEVSCAMQRLFLFTSLALLPLALLPWTVPIAAHDHLATILGSDVRFHYALELQLLEFRLFPALAVVLLLLTLWHLRRGFAGIPRAEWPFFGAVGLLTYSLMRLFLLEATRRQPVWADFWEELTELLTLAGVALVLWVFRRPLGLLRRSPPAGA